MSHEELLAKAETDAADWLECVDEWRTEAEAHAGMMRATAMTMGELCAALRAETAACMRYLAQRDEARAERNAARERITDCESALRQAAGCIAPEEMFQELGFYKVSGEWADDAVAHLEAKREVDAYFDRFLDARAERNEARARLTLAENVIRQAADGRLGRLALDYFERFPDAKERKT